MPIYEYICDKGHRFDRYLPVSEYREPQTCECGAASIKQVSLPLVFVQTDICYDSPIDGRHITSRQARIEDLARSGCIEYDPEMKKDYYRRIKDNDDRLDKAVDETIDRELAHMPARKREQLQSEMDAGFDADLVRL